VFPTPALSGSGSGSFFSADFFSAPPTDKKNYEIGFKNQNEFEN
jgi:hypothetical protein